MRRTLLGGTLLLFTLLAGMQVSAQNSCLPGWRYTQSVSIRNFIFGLLNDWQVKVTVNTQALIANGQMNPDGSDLRFTAADCCTELPYWIQSGLNTTNTVIWTRVPQLFSLDTTWIQMYYGNPNANIPVSNIDLVLFSLGNDSMGTDTATPGITVASQEYVFPINARTVQWRIFSAGAMNFKFKVSNDTNMVTGTSPVFTTGANPGFSYYLHELASIAGGHFGWYTSTGGHFLSNCAPVTPCPGSCGYSVYRTGDQGVFGALKSDTCGTVPNIKVWYRRSAFVDPSTSLWPQFDRHQPFALSSPGGNMMCFNDTLLLYAQNIGQVSYQWYRNGQAVGGATDTLIAATQDGDYHCVADFGFACQSISTDTFTISYASNQVDLGADHLICSNGSDTLDAGNQFQFYLWSDGSSGQTLEISTSGTYWVQVSDTTGCTDTDSVTVTIRPLPIPVISSLGDTALCPGESLLVTAFDTAWYAYQWLPGGETSANIQISDSGDYQVRVWDKDFCTDTSASIHVTLYPTPVLDLGPDRDFCLGVRDTLDAGPGWAAVLWPDNSTGQTYFVNTTGNFLGMVTDNNGCVDLDTVVIRVHPLPTVDLGPSDTLCPSDTRDLDAGPGMMSYTWSHGPTTQTVTVPPGIYQVAVVDSFGCTATSPLIYFTTYPALGSVVIAGDIQGLVSTSAPNYQWYMNGNAIAGANDSTLVPSGPGIYHVVVTDPYNCADQTSNSIEIVIENAITAEDIPQGFSPNNDGINDRFEIQHITEYPNSSLSIMNRWGSQVYSKAPYDNTFNGQSNSGKDLPDGTYFILLKLGNGQEFNDYLIINR